MSIKNLQAQQELLEIYRMLDIAKQTMAQHLEYMASLYIAIEEHREYDSLFDAKSKNELSMRYNSECMTYPSLELTKQDIKRKRIEQENKANGI